MPLILPLLAYGYSATAGGLTLIEAFSTATTTPSLTVDTSLYDGTSPLYILVNGNMASNNAAFTSGTLDGNALTLVADILSYSAARPSITLFKLAGTSLAASSTLALTTTTGGIFHMGYAIYAVPGATGESVVEVRWQSTAEIDLSSTVTAGQDLLAMRVARHSVESMTNTWVGLTEEFDGSISDLSVAGTHIVSGASAENVSAATPRTITTTTSVAPDQDGSAMLVIISK